MQRAVEGNGMPDQMFVIRKLEIDAPLNKAELTIPEEIKAKLQPDAKAYDPEKAQLGSQSQRASEIAPGIVFIPGPWNTTFVRQDIGIVWRVALRYSASTDSASVTFQVYLETIRTYSFEVRTKGIARNQDEPILEFHSLLGVEDHFEMQEVGAALYGIQTHQILRTIRTRTV